MAARPGGVDRPACESGRTRRAHVARLGYATRTAQRSGALDATTAAQADALLWSMRRNSAVGGQPGPAPVVIAVSDAEIARRVPPYVQGLELHRKLTLGKSHLPHLGAAIRTARSSSPAFPLRQSVLDARNSASHAPFRGGRAPALASGSVLRAAHVSAGTLFSCGQVGSPPPQARALESLEFELSMKAKYERESSSTLLRADGRCRTEFSTFWTR